MAHMSSAEMENFQDLSDRYQADIPGPLISDKLPMSVLVTEYSQADPTFVMKTTGLAATHTDYRAVKGDGQCGWRATVFRYFELLLESANPDIVQQEKIRLESFKDTMLMTGIDYELLQDMFDPTWELFDAIQYAIQNGNHDSNVVVHSMNDQTKSDFIVYHFKTITSVFMRLNPDNYSPFLEMTVDEYCAGRIDPTQQEIDQVGLQVLTDAVIAGGGFGLEVLYLDRSVGDEVTPHPFTVAREGSSVIRLLYRPGHYDIIYKSTKPLQVYLQNQQMIPQQLEDFQYDTSNDPLSYLFPPPIHQASDFDTANFSTEHQHQRQNQYQNQQQHQQQHQHQHQHQHMPCNFPQFQPPMYMPQFYEQPPSMIPAVPQQLHTSSRKSSRNSISSRSITLSPAPSSSTRTLAEPQIRFHSSMLKMDKYSGVALAAATASSTANNVSHFTNPAFQPLQYNPEDDYVNRG